MLPTLRLANLRLVASLPPCRATMPTRTASQAGLASRKAGGGGSKSGEKRRKKEPADSPSKQENADPGAVALPQSGTGTKSATKKPTQTKKQTPPARPQYTEDMRPPRLTNPAAVLLSWNVAGLRALLKKDEASLMALLAAEKADILCLQETKVQDVHTAAIEAGLPNGWHAHWNCSTTKKGYSGTAVFSRQAPLSVTKGIGVEEHDGEGRVITVELEDLYVVNAYVPNSGAKLERLEYRVTSWDTQFSAYLKGLEARKPVILTGDLNCAHQEIDIHSPKTNLRSAGFTVEERTSFTKNFIDNGFVDTFRRQYPDVVGYTYWSYKRKARENNKGWRLDYFLVSEKLAGRVHDSFMLPGFVGSDHCPLGIVVKRGNAENA